MRCVNCGNKLEPDVRFCDKCGTPVGQGVNPGRMGGMNAPQKAVVRQKDNKMSPAVIAVIIVVIVAVMAAAGYGIGRFVLSDDSGSDKKTSESKETTKDEEKSDSEAQSEDQSEDQSADEYTNQDTETGFKLEGVGAGNTSNYEVLKKQSNYSEYSDSDFSFLYPMEFFSNVSKDENGDKVTYSFTADDNITKVIYEKYDETGDPVRTVQDLDYEARNRMRYNNIEDMKQIYIPYRKNKDGVKEKNGSYLTIVSGTPKENSGIDEYQCNSSDGNKVYRMIIITKKGERDKNQSLNGAYMVDCLYRGFSKNLTDEKIRSYREFIKSGDY